MVHRERAFVFSVVFIVSCEVYLCIIICSFLALYKSMVHVMGLILSFRIMYSFVAGGHVIYGLSVRRYSVSLWESKRYRYEN